MIENNTHMDTFISYLLSHNILNREFCKTIIAIKSYFQNYIITTYLIVKNQKVKDAYCVISVDVTEWVLPIENFICSFFIKTVKKTNTSLNINKFSMFSKNLIVKIFIIILILNITLLLFLQYKNNKKN